MQSVPKGNSGQDHKFNKDESDGLLVAENQTYLDISPGSTESKLVDSWGALPTANKQTFVENRRKDASLKGGVFNPSPGKEDSPVVLAQRGHTNAGMGYPASCEKIQGFLPLPSDHPLCHEPPHMQSQLTHKRGRRGLC